MRAAVYLRISQDRTGDELGVTRQRDDAQQLVSQRGWTLIHEYPDNDVSAAGKKPRPQFDAMLASVERGEIDAIVAWSLDRLTRNRRDQLRLIETCEPHRVTIALCRGSDMDLSTPAGRMSADILASVARNEIEVKSDRSRRAREQAARQGRRVGGHRPFGYERDGVTVKEEEAAAIRKACSDVLAGVPLTAVGRAWNEAGLLSGRRRRKGERPGSLTEWSTTTVRQVLTNPRNAGLRAYKGEIVARAQWPAILDEDTYHAVMRYLSDPSRQVGTRSGQANQRLLTGVALCAECGMTVHSARARSGNPLYRCRSEYHVNRKAEPVEAYVSDLVIERLSRDDARELLTDVSKPDVDALRARAQMVRRRIDDLAAEYAADEECVMTASQMRTATGKLKAKLATVESEMADAGRVDALGPLLSSDDIASAWGMLSTARRRSVIDLLMTIRLHRTGRGVRTFRPESVEIEWKV